MYHCLSFINNVTESEIADVLLDRLLCKDIHRNVLESYLQFSTERRFFCLVHQLDCRLSGTAFFLVYVIQKLYYVCAL